MKNIFKDTKYEDYSMNIDDARETGVKNICKSDIGRTLPGGEG